MTVSPIGAAEADIEALADLHAEVLPTSLVSRLGRRYCRRFYRYCASSRLEHVITVARDGGLAGGAMVSLQPASLSSRLLRETPLLLAAVLNFWRVPWLRLISPERGASQREETVPELIELLVNPRHQGAGIGRQLLAEVEAWLARQGVERYDVKTFADVAHPAAKFYMTNGFRITGTARGPGADFTLLRKTLREG